MTALSTSVRSRRLFLARALAATDAWVAATALARPCRTRSRCPSAHSRAACGSAGCSSSGFAEAADVDEVDEHRHCQATGPGVVADGGDLLLVPVDEVIHPAGQILGQAGQLGPADPHPMRAAMTSWACP